MSQLSAQIVYATFKALDEGEKEAFVRLIEEEKKKYKPKKPKNHIMHKVADQLGEQWRPGNFEMLVAVLWHNS